MLDIFKNLPGLNNDDLEKDAEDRKPNAMPNGPVQFRKVSNGQVRRAGVNAQHSAHKKKVAKLRKTHWEYRLEASRIEAYLAALEKDGRDDATEWLEKRYETVEGARARLRALYGQDQA